MSTMKQLKAAEHAMRVAHRALMEYTERPADEQDPELRRCLAAEARIAAETYVKTVLALNSK